MKRPARRLFSGIPLDLPPRFNMHVHTTVQTPTPTAMRARYTFRHTAVTYVVWRALTWGESEVLTGFIGTAQELGKVKDRVREIERQVWWSLLIWTTESKDVICFCGSGRFYCEDKQNSLGPCVRSQLVCVCFYMNASDCLTVCREQRRGEDDCRQPLTARSIQLDCLKWSQYFRLLVWSCSVTRAPLDSMRTQISCVTETSVERRRRC